MEPRNVSSNKVISVGELGDILSSMRYLNQYSEWNGLKVTEVFIEKAPSGADPAAIWRNHIEHLKEITNVIFATLGKFKTEVTQANLSKVKDLQKEIDSLDTPMFQADSAVKNLEKELETSQLPKSTKNEYKNEIVKFRQKASGQFFQATRRVMQNLEPPSVKPPNPDIPNTQKLR